MPARTISSRVSVLIRALAAVSPDPHRMTRCPNSLSVIP